MDSDRLNRWLTLGANVGVLIGLIILIVEIGQNTDIMRAQMAQSRADNLISSMEDRIHSDHWPAISAKLRVDGEFRPDRLSDLSPEERERVFYYYLREMNDLRAQFLQLQAGYLPRDLWDTSSRNQVIRTLRFAAAFKRPCSSDRDFVDELNRIAREEGIMECISSGTWE